MTIDNPFIAITQGDFMSQNLMPGSKIRQNQPKGAALARLYDKQIFMENQFYTASRMRDQYTNKDRTGTKEELWPIPNLPFDCSS